MKVASWITSQVPPCMVNPAEYGDYYAQNNQCPTFHVFLYLDVFKKLSSHEWITAIATIIIAWFTGTIWSINRRQLVHSHNVERAYISGGGVRTQRFHSMSANQMPIMVDAGEFQFHINNFGIPPMHPGEMLREEFLAPLRLRPYAVAKACGVPRNRIERIAREELGVSADTALRLGKFFGTSAQFWLNLQSRRDLLTAERRIATALWSIKPFKHTAA